MRSAPETTGGQGPGKPADRYLPIGDYAMIGDCHTVALISTDGSIDWYCPGRFDAPAVFCRILDADRGGYFETVPRRQVSATRRYIGQTNVLETTFDCDTGRVRVLDFMPIHKQAQTWAGYDMGTSNRLVRLIEGLEGAVEMDVCFRPAFDFARADTQTSQTSTGVVASAGGQYLALACPTDLEVDSEGTARGRLRVRAGERQRIALTYAEDADAARAAVEPADNRNELDDTLQYWEQWAGRCTYRGPYRDLVMRSALALKLLDYEPSGALVAAPTTSLPEEIGGVRNWDYRYTWLRDSALVLYSLHLVGYHDEALDFFAWLEDICIRCRGDVRVMYTVRGGSHLPERTLDNLEGYRASRPVRTGNAAANQVQLDVYGEVLDAAHICHVQMGHAIRADLWHVLSFLADRAAARWREPDYGIWEVRGGSRHFLHSKLQCWVALDRALSLAERSGLHGNVAHWRRTRSEIRRTILDEGYNRSIGAFTQVLGGSALDASALVIPLTGFLPATDPRVRSTVARIREQLMSNGLVYRYLADDGLPGGEATFALCSFWLVDNLTLAGELDEARELFEHVVGFANDLGLLSEQINPGSGELLGNYPQGFTHLALIRAALHIAKAEADGAEKAAERPAERMAETKRTGAATSSRGASNS